MIQKVYASGASVEAVFEFDDKIERKPVVAALLDTKKASAE